MFVKRYLTGRLNHTVAIAAVAGLIFTLAIPFSSSQAKSAPAHAAAELEAVNVNDGFANLVEAVRPAVVNISTTGHISTGSRSSGNQFGQGDEQLEEFFKRFFGERGQQFRQQAPDQKPYERKTTALGSGFVIDPAGLVVTNNHVIEDADEIEVIFEDGKRLPATIKGVDEKTDLAVLEVKTAQPLPFVKFGDSESARVGDWVVAIGNPFGLGGSTTSGIISARGRDINSGPLDDFIQIDAPINRGNSGGPLFNTKGEVIGVNSAIYSPNGGSVGIGFAIPANLAENVVSQLADSGIVQRGFLGVHIQAVSDEIAESLGLEKARGALVTKVVSDSPADEAGLEAGDIILEFDGKDVNKMRDLPKLVANTSGSEEVSMKVWRNNDAITLSAIVGDDKAGQVAVIDENDASSTGNLGLALAQLNDENRDRYGLEKETDGVVIVDVNPDGNAAKKGLREGDVIKRVGQSAVTTPDDVQNAVSANRKAQKKSVLLLVERENNTRYVVVPMSS